MAFFNTYFWNLLPEWFKQPNYNDSLGNPLLKRYLLNFGDELDEQVIPLIDNFLNIFNLILTDDIYLPYIGYLLGSLPGIDGDNTLYRYILANAIEIIQKKGTIPSYELYFAILGMKIVILEDKPNRGGFYDDNRNYDESPVMHYDEQCDNCSGYSIGYRSLGGGPITDDFLNKTLNVICFLQPINAIFNGFIKMSEIDEDVEIATLETLS